MKKSTLTSIVWILALFGVVFATFGGAVPVLAQDGTPEAPTLPDPDVDVTVVVPDTGGDADNDTVAFSGWTLLLILGVAVVVLLIALLARGGTTHTHD